MTTEDEKLRDKVLKRMLETPPEDSHKLKKRIKVKKYGEKGRKNKGK